MGQHGNIKQNGSTLQNLPWPMLMLNIITMDHQPTKTNRSLYGEYKKIHDYMNSIGHNKKILGDVYKKQYYTKLAQTKSILTH
jgi:hypothetical protein